MNYTLHQLRVFQKVVEFKSITKAAESLNMTQPAVSIQLKNLQEQFDMPITELLGRQLQITDFGMELYQIAGRISDEVDLIDYRTTQYRGLLAGKLKLASVSTGKYVIPHYLKGFLNEHDGIDLELDVTNRRHVIQALERNEVDFALMTILPENLKIEEELLLLNKIILVGANSIEDNENIFELPLIYREEGSGTRLTMQQFFESHNHKPKKRFQLQSNEAVKQAVIAGLGYSILPLVSLKNELKEEQIKIINGIDLPIVNEWKLVWLKNKRLSPIAKAFLEYVQTNKEQIEASVFSWMNKF
jgi:LysR family transcriptional regulator, low CO2-responsive transcriptional regulator